jgi:hypothetical protein
MVNLVNVVYPRGILLTLTAPGDALVDMISDRGSTPLASTKKTAPLRADFLLQSAYLQGFLDTI